MRRTILALAAVLAATTVAAQESTHYKKPIDPEAGLPLYQRKYMPPPDPIGDVPPGWSLSAQPLVMPPAPPIGIKPEPVVMNGGMGGVIWEHQSRFNLLAARGAAVEMRGGCWSACTLITGYIPKDRLCFAPGAFLAFHAAVTAAVPHRRSMPDTWTMYFAMPAQIQQWLDANGGPYKMTVENYWFLRDSDLWAMGYPRCK